MGISSEYRFCRSEIPFTTRIASWKAPEVMLYGQNLPWWLALRNTTRGASRQSSNLYNRLYTTAQRCRIPAATSPSLRPLLPGQPISGSSRFSTTPARRKDANKPSKDAVEEVTEDNSKNKIEEPKEASGDNVAETKSKNPESTPPSGNASSGSAADGKGSAAATGASGDSGSGDGGKKVRKPSAEKALQKPTVPDVYPQVMALPISKRPLFPGFYKAITVRDPNVVAAIQDMIKRGQPYIGAFLFKD